MTTQAKDFTMPLPHSANPAKEMPLLGLGTWKSKPGEVESIVYEALKLGYRHIDAAAKYGNEIEVGRGIKKWLCEGGKRDEIWITSKLWCNAHQPAEVPKALEKTLQDLKLDYIDLYLIHWPVAFVAGEGDLPKDENGVMKLDKSVTLEETWRAMEEALDSGKTKNIGLSNFSKTEVEAILKVAQHRPDCIQMELHPYLNQAEYTGWLKTQGIAVSGYSPFGNLNPSYKSEGDIRIIDQSIVKQIAQKTGHTRAQTILSYGIAKGWSVTPKTVSIDRMKENMGVFVMDPEDVKRMDTLNQNKRYSDVSEAFGHVFFADEKPPRLGQHTNESMGIGRTAQAINGILPFLEMYRTGVLG